MSARSTPLGSRFRTARSSPTTLVLLLARRAVDLFFRHRLRSRMEAARFPAVGTTAAQCRVVAQAVDVAVVAQLVPWRVKASRHAVARGWRLLAVVRVGCP